MNIILIGYRASGKTSIGKKLASSLWYTYADVDREGCKRLGNRTIAQIWNELGEPEWRRVETEVTRELVNKPKHVIGLGGGTLMQPAARLAVVEAKDAVRIYLKCNPEELARRISADPQSSATRPNLTNFGGGIEEIKAVLAQRELTYLEVADKVFDVTHVTVEAAVQHLLAKYV